jgi:hypothetical protein
MIRFRARRVATAVTVLLCGSAALGVVLHNPTIANGGAAASDGTLFVLGEFAAGRVSAGNVTLDEGAIPAFLAAPTITPGDLNCDGSVGFPDINPFVLFLSNFSAWQATYPDCPPENGDINGDGLYPDFGDINPFVALLTGM